jgi:hypothetical protein
MCNYDISGIVIGLDSFYFAAAVAFGNALFTVDILVCPAGFGGVGWLVAAGSLADLWLAFFSLALHLRAAH